MTHTRQLALAALLVPAILLAACSAAAPAPTAPVATSTPPAAAPPIGVVPPITGVPPTGGAPGTTPDPGGSTGSGTAGGGSGGSGGSTGSGTDPGGGAVPGNPGDGTVTSPPVIGGGGGPVPNPQPTIVSPTAGLTGIHAVGATQLLAAVNDRDVTVRIAWWSGVAPCSVLAGVDVVRDGTTFTLTVREGAGQQGVACDEIAMYKATNVDLGTLDPGSYTIKATGDAPAITVIVAG